MGNVRASNQKGAGAEAEWFHNHRHLGNLPCARLSLPLPLPLLLLPQEDSAPAYLATAEECLGSEEERVASYLHISTKPKLMKEAETQLLKVHQQQLLEKEHSGCAALLRDDKVRVCVWGGGDVGGGLRATSGTNAGGCVLCAVKPLIHSPMASSSTHLYRCPPLYRAPQKTDLSRMYRLFNRLPRGLEPMADIFRRHVEEEGAFMSLTCLLACCRCVSCQPSPTVPEEPLL